MRILRCPDGSGSDPRSNRLPAIQLLQRAGIEVIYPQGQTCCGQPAWNSGYRHEARQVARAQLKCFPKPYPVIVPSASCAGMMKHHYPPLFEGCEEADFVQQFSGRVYELTEYLVDVLDIQLTDLGPPLEVAVHSSCSARREMVVADKIESLLKQLDNVMLLEQSHKAECCGFGGTFVVKQPEISAAMVTDKTQAILETGARVFVTQDCGCMMNISGAFEYQGGKSAQPTAEGFHIADFLWKRTHG